MSLLSDLINVVAMVANPSSVVGALSNKSQVVASAPVAVATTHVRVTGTASTYEQAVEDAKTQALSRLNGLIVLTTATTTKTTHTSSTSEYSSGMIQSYSVVNVDKNIHGLFVVELDVVVQQRKNHAVVNEKFDDTWHANAAGVLAESSKQEVFLPALTTQPLYDISVKSVVAKPPLPDDKLVSVTIKFSVSWASRFVNDLRMYAENSGRATTVNDRNNRFAVCYGSSVKRAPDSKCYDVGTEIAPLVQPVSVRIQFNNGANVVNTLPVGIRNENELRLPTFSGQSFYHSSSGRQVTYGKGVVMYEKAMSDQEVTVRIPVTLINQTTSIVITQ